MSSVLMHLGLMGASVYIHPTDAHVFTTGTSLSAGCVTDQSVGPVQRRQLNGWHWVHGGLFLGTAEFCGSDPKVSAEEPCSLAPSVVQSELRKLMTLWPEGNDWWIQRPEMKVKVC